MKKCLGDDVDLYFDTEDGGSDEYCGIVSFSMRGIDPREVKRFLLVEGGFTTSVVPKTSTPLNSSRTKCGDLVRVSLSYFNTEDEIERLCDVLKRLVEARAQI